MGSSSDESEWEKDQDLFRLFDADWEEMEAARAARQAGGEKALEPGTAAVAAEPGDYHLVLDAYFAPIGATAICQMHDTDLHAIIREQWRLAGKPLGELPATDATDSVQEELAQNMNMTWHDVSNPPVAQPQDGLEPMYVPNNALPSYLPSQLGLE